VVCVCKPPLAGLTSVVGSADGATLLSLPLQGHRAAASVPFCVILLCLCWSPSLWVMLASHGVAACARLLPRLMVTRVDVELRLCAPRLLWVCRRPRLEGCHGVHRRISPRRLLVYVDHSSRGCDCTAGVAAGGDAVDAAVVEAAVLAEIKGSLSGAEHFRVISVMGNGEFGYVFKVRCGVTELTDLHDRG
jgi:hypothetical protein